MFIQILFLVLALQKSQTKQVNEQNTQITFLENQNFKQQDPYEINYEEEEPSGSNVFFYFHQYANFITWAILVDLGIIANRYGILIQYKIEVHAIIMTLVIIPSVIAEFFMIFADGEPELYGQESLEDIHGLLGFFFLGLIIVQVIGGLVLKFCILSIKKQNHLKIKSILHIYLGYAIYIFGKIQLGFGYYLSYTNAPNEGQGSLTSFWCVYSLIFFWRIIFEFLYQNGKIYQLFKQQKERPRQHSGTLQDSLLIQYIEQNEQSQLINEFQNKFWVIFNNEIIDLTEFVHPGGQYIWNKVKGREISRFLYGGCGLEDETAKQYQHTKNAIVLLKNNVIGTLNSIAFTIPIGESAENTGTQWKLNTITILNDKTSYFGFLNPQFRIISQFTSIHSFGKYFQLKSLESKNIPIRQYTCVSSMAPENVEYRRELVQYVESIVNNNQQAKAPLQPKYLNELPMIIKYYDSQNGFSKYIHNHKGEYYDIQGPYGPPHGIPNRGKIVIISGGTGIFPFLDLLDFLLKSITYSITLNKYGKKAADNLNPYDCQFNTNVHVTLFFAVANRSELIGSDILFPIIQIQKHLEKEVLRLIIKIREKIDGIETINERYSKEMFGRVLGNNLDYQRYLICGPPQMQASVPPILREMGVQDHLIHFI
ncbi:unnamed protein product [Paramecium primaurelia]|uniref:Cytochrome b5 heme-binding domain-containing protein n=1 Tax=Paramecium primaurelia TaxID=5886 RepID=A0A8S1PWB7_PARPR|nr:unnamed protein product [Paramecium primaurelia]